MRIGPYEVVREIGRGGMGVVYEARDVAGSRVAVKVLLRKTKSDLARFERERRLLAGLTLADGFVPLLDGGTHASGSGESAAWIAMPFLGGGTLRDRLKRGPLEIVDALELGRALARALARCHAKGIIHRDLKPANVLFDENDRPVIADLGLAKHFRDDVSGASQSASLSVTGELRGTIGYAAPEQLADAKEATPAADVFSVGAILYECLTGKAAFEGDTFLQVVNKVRQGKYEPIEELRPATPSWLVAEIDRTLLPDAISRPQDGAELLDLLETGPGSPRRSWLPVAGAVFLGAVVAAVAIGAVMQPKAPPESPKTTNPNAEPEPTLARALERVTAGDYATALELATRAVDRFPGSARARAVRGRVLLARLEYGRAEEDLARAIELDASLAQAWGDRACCRVAHVSSSASALAYAERAVALDPKSPDSYLARAFARATPDPAGAEADARRALALVPRDPRAWCALADAACGRADWPDAIAACDRALALDDGHPLALCLRAIARGWLERNIDRALADADKALVRAPRAAVAWRLRALTVQMRDEWHESVPDLRTAVECDPTDPKSWGDLGVALDAIGDERGAEEALGRAIDLAPEEKRSWQSRARVRLRHRDAKGAEADAARTIELAPRDPDAWSEWAQACFLLQRYADAVRGYEHTVDLEPRAEAWKHLGQARLFTRDFLGARAALDRSLALKSDDAQAHQYRAVALEQLGDRAGAIEDLERYLEITPNGEHSDEARADLRRLRGR